MAWNKLSPEEERVIVRKGTEWPFTGEYDRFYKEGTYVCRRCNAALYTSDSKFDAGCGWPAFDREIPGWMDKGGEYGLRHHRLLFDIQRQSIGHGRRQCCGDPP